MGFVCCVKGFINNNVIKVILFLDIFDLRIDFNYLVCYNIYEMMVYELL